MASSRISRAKSSNTVQMRSNLNGGVKYTSKAVENHKKRIMEVVARLTDEELEKVSEMLKESEAVQDNNGDGRESVAQESLHEGDDYKEDREACGDAEERDEVASVASRALSKTYTSVSRLSSRTYISQL